MKVEGEDYRSIWFECETLAVKCIDQTRLPHEFVVLTLNDLASACGAISTMQVRGAPLIGVTAAYGMYLALRDDPGSYDLARARLLATRPTAVNLQWALRQVDRQCAGLIGASLVQEALATAQRLAEEDVNICASIGEFGAAVFEKIWRAKPDQGPLNVLTHCNAGWLATVDWGTALAVIYKTAARGIPLHVWVDETRPRNQGAALTCWELAQHGIPNTLIVDNAGGHLMQHGQVDVCIVGSDRTTANGDVCNKVGSYLKALAAFDNGVPFYAAVPVSTIDFAMSDGVAEIPIELRSPLEVTHMTGINEQGVRTTIQLSHKEVVAHNVGFDVTPARLVTGIITERGVYQASHESLLGLNVQTV
ncbi:MAG: methylthioribose-1-phosphate isomerase [Pseudohongiellaceae bacterium]|jgi:methylthioribose-1-phosphate isomerase